VLRCEVAAQQLLQQRLLDLLLGIDLAMKLLAADYKTGQVFPYYPLFGRSVSHDPLYVRDRDTSIYVVSSASHCDWGATGKLRTVPTYSTWRTDITFEPTSPELTAYYATSITRAAHTSHLFSLVSLLPAFDKGKVRL